MSGGEPRAESRENPYPGARVGSGVAAAVESEEAMKYARLGEIIAAIIGRHYADEARKGGKGAA